MLTLIWGFTLDLWWKYQCFSCCRAMLTLTPGPSSFSCYPASSQDRWTKLAQRDIPYHMASCSAIKVGGKERQQGGGMIRVMMFVFPSKCYMWWSPMFLPRHLSPNRKRQINSLFCFACMQFLLYLLNSLHVSSWVLTTLQMRRKLLFCIYDIFVYIVQ